MIGDVFSVPWLSGVKVHKQNLEKYPTLSLLIGQCQGHPGL